MTDVLDAAALVAFVRLEPAHAEVEKILLSGSAAISAINLGEAVDTLHRRHGVPRERLDAVLQPLLDDPLLVLPVEARVAWRAAALRRVHYHRTRRPLSLADCCCLAGAAGHGDVVVTSDRPLLDAAREEGVAVVALPDSRGRRI
ncbi:MAG: PIN domain-containing protein [Solirubrobacteraceae bacterium MAG38_C4-C5]|nr:PIN domain-containing protein [Candidatus Siliceabacter maunaloa]